MLYNVTKSEMLTAAVVATKYAVYATGECIADAKRRVVIDCLYWKGQFRDLFEDDEWERIYVAADGFGKFSTWKEMIDGIGGLDWSHIRDSSEEAFAEMFSRVVAFVGKKVAVREASGAA